METIPNPKIFKNLEELYHFLDTKLDPALLEAHKSFSLFLPERIAKKIKSLGIDSALAREFLPNLKEINQQIQIAGLKDPIGDQEFNKAPQLIHRYYNRALFTPTSVCPIHCRYCFRRNELNPTEDLFKTALNETLNYLHAHPEIEEIIFTGGDPLSLSNEKMERYFEEFSQLTQIKHLRIHTRYPVILPERIDANFISILNKYSSKFTTLSIAIHTNHLDEFDQDVEEAIKNLNTTQTQLLSQTVLLKGVNNDEDSLLNLFQKLISLKIRPYYLHHPDQVSGGMHFYLPLNEGRKIYAKLRNKLPGWALPHYVIDIPGGEGKVQAFNPESKDYQGKLFNKSGELVSHTEPNQNDLVH